MLADNLPERDLNNLLRCSKHLHRLLNGYLYKVTVKNRGNNTLFWACVRGQPKVAQRLLALGVSAETSCEGGLRVGLHPLETPLLSAVLYAKADCVKILLDHGVNINAQGRSKLNPLELATKEGKIEIVRMLLKHGADISLGGAYRNFTPLHSAVFYKHGVAMLELLLDNNADPNALDDEQCTPLHLAPNKDIAEILIKRGASINVANRMDQTPLSIAIKAKDKDWVAMLLRYNKHIAGANVHHTDNQQSTALFSICLHGDQKTVRLLLDNRCNPSTRNRKGLTPVHIAAEEGWPKICKMLLEAGANVNAINYYRSTPLHRLTSIPKRRLRHLGNLERYQETIEVLIDFGANVNAVDRIGQTPLMKSAYHGYWRFVDRLVKEDDVDLTIKDRRGKKASELAKDGGFESRELINLTKTRVAEMVAAAGGAAEDS
ncbi:ankyrin repeat-containing domain protein [Sphaerosporella brunnea]|uniref:Ankyrin repeat-containing domain protein n=1 Tax=Sphaerosporella brunnea TaxID=1250544 RepID=A0A5J5EH39_9PEZI|nr:ankyrin repeat-containing domain protein [Sphaerosporella brunnea]